VSTPLRLVAAGDAIINRRVSSLEDADFVALRELVLGADVGLANFETTTPHPPLVPAPSHGLALSSPAFVIDELRWMGFSLLGVANNHALAYGTQGFIDTLDELRARGAAFAGGGRTLAEARAPGYHDSRHGRVALVGATVTNASAVLAADPGRGTTGRPGANPLRASLAYHLDDARFGHLADIDEAIGTAEARRSRERFGPLVSAPASSRADEIRFLGGTFVRDTDPGVRGRLHARDIASLERSIGDARRQADVVVVSIHCHEGEAGSWNGHVPPDFLVDAAHRCIDAGADLIAGHGPHLLRGVEIYDGKPILYSLGNLFLQVETVEPVPPEVFEAQGLPTDGMPADFHDHGSIGPDGAPIGFAADPVWWESLVAECTFDAGRLAALRLHPVELGFELPRSRRGVPRLVGAERGSVILERVGALSRELGTDLVIEIDAERAVARPRAID
jgi:poly-gamma-glutamate capsule biosynthesis protein CapA/YwtB (metallophosphatase superfamily)